MRPLIVLAAVLALFGAMVAPAVADDLIPPQWRGHWSTTSQIWEFLTPINPAPPDGPAPGGQPPLPSTIAQITPGPGMEWIPVDPDSQREGIWPLSGRIDVTVDNLDPEWEIKKIIWLQLTWQPQQSGAQPGVFMSMPSGGVIGPFQPVEERPVGPNGWTYGLYTHVFPNNPPEEYITISGMVNVDQMVIDTGVVPEPATWMLLGCGLVALAIGARRRK